MPKKPQNAVSSVPNIINIEDIDQFLRDFAGEDERVFTLLKTLFDTPLKKTHIFTEKIDELPKDAPQWLVKKWNNGERSIFHRFNPKSNPKQVQVIWEAAVWIEKSIKNNESWLQNTNDQGVPEILLGHDNVDSCQELIHQFEPPKTSEFLSKSYLEELKNNPIAAILAPDAADEDAFCPTDRPIYFQNITTNIDLHASTKADKDREKAAQRRAICGRPCSVIDGKLSMLETPECFTKGVKDIIE